MPFVLPIQADKTPVGFDLAFLRLIEGTPSRTGRICCSVEDVPEVCAQLKGFHSREIFFSVLLMPSMWLAL